MDFAKTQIGTPVYMAPEVWSGKLYSYSSDLWSLGCVLYEMMTFKVPIEGRTMQELKVKVSSGRYTPISPGRYSQELIGFCHSLLSLDPRRRPLPNDILSSSAAAKWLRVLPAPTPGSAPESRPSSAAQAPAAGAKMLNTIIVPRDIRQLNKVLPPPSYDVKLAPAPSSQPSDVQQAKDQAAGSNPPSRPSSREQVALPGGGKPVIPRSHSAQMKPLPPGVNPLYGYKGAAAVVPLPSIQGLRQVSDNALNGQRHPVPGRRISLS
jgi:serine/threonine protein kinase